MKHEPRGSLWNRWDLHFHTPSSFDYGDMTVTNQQIVDGLIDQNVKVVAITDHHILDIVRVKELQELGGRRLTVLPGIELRDDHGGQPIHYISIFSEDCDLDHVWTTMQGALGLTAAAIREKGGDERVYVPIEKGAKITRELGGLVSIHAGAKSNSIETIRNHEEFQQQIKYDITKDWVDLLEIGQIKDIDRHLGIIFPKTGLERPLIICSDNHKVSDYSVKAPLWLRSDPTFRGLLMICREPVVRVFIGDRPPEVLRTEQNPTKCIRGISFVRKSSAPPNEQWFNGSIEFNPGLIAIVGNKGSGKSALSDTLGLLGSTKNAASFSFLSKDRFRHPTGGYANHFEATLEWNSGEKTPRTLSDTIRREEVERVKYLPQDHVERVCNELESLGEEGFERELKDVIFSHVPEDQRLGQFSLDELVRFRTEEKQSRIDSLIKQLRESSRIRSQLEAQGDPLMGRALEEKIKRRRLELDAHDKGKPIPMTDPSVGSVASTIDPVVLADLEACESRKKLIAEKILKANGALRAAQRRLAVANRLIERLDNFGKEFRVFQDSLQGDATELGLSGDDLVSMSIRDKEVKVIVKESGDEIANLTLELEGVDPPGLQLNQSECAAKILDLQTRLDAPNRAYKAYLKELADWEARRATIVGDKEDGESLLGLEAAHKALEGVPARIATIKTQQLQLATQIHSEKVAQAEIYRVLYGPVQQFIDTHELAKDKLSLEFRAELTEEDFAGKLLSHLALNRRGSFMGIDEGRARAESLAASTKWGDPKSVQSFLTKVDAALFSDQRESPPIKVLLKDQLLKGKTPEEVFNLLYGLEFVRPRYVLKWEGKDLSMLSPGERGTLLLVFYLLIDKNDTPLVMDQPEGNLDNHTVAKVLVDCIREARRRRQVFIVTHNPNLAVVCDADQVVYTSIDKSNGNAITYTTGSLENPAMSQYVTDVLEGTRWAFGVRDGKYKVAE